MAEREFTSPTKGEISFDDMFEEIIRYIGEGPDMTYKLIVGTDSQMREDEVNFVTAIIIHRVGKGARYFYHRQKLHNIYSLRQKIFYETSLSLETASRIAGKLAATGLDEQLDLLNVEIHLDVGQEGRTRELIREVIGMVAGSGFSPRIKPDSYGASKVADKYTK